MNKGRRAGGLFVLLVCTTVLLVFVYCLVKISFQNGASSSEITNSIAYKLGTIVFEGDLTDAEIAATNRLLRFSAHFVLFAALGYGLSVVGFLVFTRPFGRFASLILNIGICFALSYYTEYNKQFIEGRHFQMADVTINVFGSIVGVCFMIVSLFVFSGINARKRR